MLMRELIVNFIIINKYIKIEITRYKTLNYNYNYIKPSLINLLKRYVFVCLFFLKVQTLFDLRMPK